MQTYDDCLCIFYMLQIIIGIFGNDLLLCLYGFNLISSQRIRSIDVILVNLALSHIILILFRGVPLAIKVCNQKIFLSDNACKIIIYLQRVARGLSLCTTCLLSIFQTIIISSSSPQWTKLRAKDPKFIALCCVFIWVLSLLIDMDVPLYVTGTRNNTVIDFKGYLGFCFIDWHAISMSKLVIWKTLYDAVFMGFMAITNAYMVLFLVRHHWKIQYLHNTTLKPIASPETRATKVILLLMIIFVCFYSLASIFVIFMENSKDTNQYIMYIPVLLSLSYAIISPFVLISSDSHVFIYSIIKNFYLNILKSHSKDTKTISL
ncbi:vomeronasal type-1 receptor 4-like [Macrotis lagotis]|uniref:vomeronasal type-1 receptor 4-like n=1 Tax=Macrotis lagotis TaxID=92651 RepID=UPI003D69D2E5